MTGCTRVLGADDSAAYAAFQIAVAPHFGAYALDFDDDQQLRFGVVTGVASTPLLVAACAVMCTPAAFEVLDVAVRETHRRRGWGRALIAMVLERARAEGQAVWLEVREENEAARALYTALGFVETGRRPAYYRTENGTCDAVLMNADPL